MKQVLIIDDEIDLCELLSFQLSSLGLSSEYVNTIRDAKAKMIDGAYDLIFLDLNLKDGSGFEMLKFINHLPTTQRVIVISAYDTERRKVLGAGADFFLEKPFSKKKVVQLLEML